MAGTQRRLAAILFSDIAGYTALMAANEAAGLRARTRHRSLLRSLAARHHGKVVDENGDELVLVFPSDLDAVHCALAAQANLREDAEMKLRIGIHSGDVIFEGGRVYGDGVNVASRIRPLAEPGGVAVSEPVFEAVKGQVGLEFTPLGKHALKNVTHPLSVYAVTGTVETPSRLSALVSDVGTGRAAMVVALAIAAATGFMLVRDWRPSSPALPASVVVLPFADMSPNGDQEFFADGVSEEIINALARLPDLRVVARTSAFAFKGKDADIRTIGEQLGVRHVVEGSVRRSGDRLRVTAQLISVADGYHVWSETYERELADVFAIQEDVATRVAEALSVRIGGRSLAPRQARDLRAYELYLTGRQLWSLRTEEGMRRSIEYFEQALARDPSYAPALSGIADAWTHLYSYGFESDPTVIDRAREAAQAALRTDPTLGPAYASLGRLQYAGGTWNWEEAEDQLRRAINLAPSYATAHQWHAAVLMARGRLAEGLAEIQQALELDPLSSVIAYDAGGFASMAGDHERAIDLHRRAVDLSPRSVRWRLGLSAAYGSAGREGDALEAVLAAVPPAAQDGIRTAVEAGGSQAVVELLLRMEQERTGQPCTAEPQVAAALYARLGAAEGVFRCLEEGARRGNWTYVKLDPVFAPYRSDPRYAAYLKSINLSE